MVKAKRGDTVKVDYTGKLQDGTVFDTSTKPGPLEFTLGKGEVISGLEEAVVGMTPGQSKNVEVPPKRGFASHRDDMVAVIDKNRLPKGMEPRVGQQLEFRSGENPPITARVTEVSESEVTVDANHALAGEYLTFEIRLVDIG